MIHDNKASSEMIELCWREFEKNCQTWPHDYDYKKLLEADFKEYMTASLKKG